MNHLSTPLQEKVALFLDAKDREIERLRRAAEPSEPRDRSVKAVIERLRFGDSDGDDHDIAAQALSEIERLRNDIQELTCGDPRKVCPNCRDAAEPTADLAGLLREVLKADDSNVDTATTLPDDLTDRIRSALNRGAPHE